jgi:hypothetical protein
LHGNSMLIALSDGIGCSGGQKLSRIDGLRLQVSLH